MNVGEVIELLKKCDPNAIVVAHLAFRGVEEITALEVQEVGALGNRMSWDKVKVVEFTDGHGAYMQSKGHRVLYRDVQGGLVDSSGERKDE